MYGIKISRTAEITLARQIYQQLTEAILAARICSGEKLPSSRELAAFLKVSRNTVNEAYEMLKTEGYISSRMGSSFFVKDALILNPTGWSEPVLPPAHAPAIRFRYDFRTGAPDLSAFPAYSWSHSLQQALPCPDSDLMYGSPKGTWQLRREIASWLFRSKGMKADPHQIFITSGSTHAMSLLADILSTETGCFILEDPCHIGIRNILEIKQTTYHTVTADQQGLQTDRLTAVGPLSAIYVTPSHQFPLGGIMPAERRVELVQTARRRAAYIIEDDYDSEFRYGGAPVTPLYGMAPDRVIYIGTFSKILFPALRIGFAILPGELHERWIRLRRYSDVQNPIVDQLTLAAFLESRKLDKHVRTMKKLYAGKRKILLDAVRQYFKKDIEIIGDASGLHLGLRLPHFHFNQEFARRCKDRELIVTPCEDYDIGSKRNRDILLLGYGNITSEEIPAGIQLLHRMVYPAADD